MCRWQRWYRTPGSTLPARAARNVGDQTGGGGGRTSGATVVGYAARPTASASFSVDLRGEPSEFVAHALCLGQPVRHASGGGNHGDNGSQPCLGCNSLGVRL